MIGKLAQARRQRLDSRHDGDLLQRSKTRRSEEGMSVPTGTGQISYIHPQRRVYFGCRGPAQDYLFFELTPEEFTWDRQWHTLRRRGDECDVAPRQEMRIELLWAIIPGMSEGASNELIVPTQSKEETLPATRQRGGGAASPPCD